MLPTLNIRKKGLNRNDKEQFISLLSEVLAHGFTFEQSLHFISTMTPKWSRDIKIVEQKLLKGCRLSTSLCYLGFSLDELVPIRFAEVHGDMVGTLERMNSQLKEKNKQRKDMLKVMSYPLFLLLFLCLMLLGMKMFILPQLSEFSNGDNTNYGLTLINNSLKYGMVIFIIIVLGGYFIDKYLTRKSLVVKLNIYAKLPLVNRLVKSYYTSLFATEWGNLLSQGMEFRDVILVMEKRGYAKLMQEMAFEIRCELEKGKFIDEPISSWLFLKPELTLIIRQGEVNGKLGQELVVYGKKEWERFVEKGEKLISLMQPISFIIIAMMIVSIYGSLLLPIYSGMGEFY